MIHGALLRVEIRYAAPRKVLLGFREVEAGMAPPPPSDPPAVRRLLRELRRARANSRRVVAWFLAEMAKRDVR